MPRYRLVFLDYDENAVGEVDYATADEPHLNGWIVLDQDIWLVASIEPSDTPYAAKLDCMYVGLVGDPDGLQETDPDSAATRAGAKSS